MTPRPFLVFEALPTEGLDRTTAAQCLSLAARIAQRNLRRVIPRQVSCRGIPLCQPIHPERDSSLRSVHRERNDGKRRSLQAIHNRARFVQNSARHSRHAGLRIDAQHRFSSGGAQHHPASLSQIQFNSVQVFATSHGPVEQPL